MNVKSIDLYKIISGASMIIACIAIAATHSLNIIIWILLGILIALGFGLILWGLFSENKTEKTMKELVSIQNEVKDLRKKQVNAITQMAHTQNEIKKMKKEQIKNIEREKRDSEEGKKKKADKIYSTLINLKKKGLEPYDAREIANIVNIPEDELIHLCQSDKRLAIVYGKIGEKEVAMCCTNEFYKENYPY